MYTYMSCATGTDSERASLRKFYMTEERGADSYGIEELELAVVTQDFLMHINNPHKNSMCICDKCAEYQRKIGKLERCVKN